MSLTWEQGRDTIEAMLRSGVLERIPASREHAQHLIGQARRHLASAVIIADADPDGGYAMVYDAARKALAAVLENEGLRTTSLRGHHQSGYEAVVAQLDPPMGPQLRPFLRMRQTRAAAEYPVRDRPALTQADVLDDHAKSEQIVDICASVLDHMPVFVPR